MVAEHTSNKQKKFANVNHLHVSRQKRIQKQRRPRKGERENKEEQKERQRKRKQKRGKINVSGHQKQTKIGKKERRVVGGRRERERERDRERSILQRLKFRLVKNLSNN